MQGAGPQGPEIILTPGSWSKEQETIEKTFVIYLAKVSCSKGRTAFSLSEVSKHSSSWP